MSGKILHYGVPVEIPGGWSSGIREFMEVNSSELNGSDKLFDSENIYDLNPKPSLSRNDSPVQPSLIRSSSACSTLPAHAKIVLPAKDVNKVIISTPVIQAK